MAFMRPVAAAIVMLALAACSDHDAAPKLDLASAPARAEFASVSFEELYPTFLQRRSMSLGEKSTLWSRYRGRWVRWEGVLASFNDKGVTLRQLLSTVTFDVSLTCERAAIATLQSRFAVGDRVRYVGMLDSYDDIFRTLYLAHGAVVEKVPHGDLGVPADMAHPLQY
jgi:hypothetical protein